MSKTRLDRQAEEKLAQDVTNLEQQLNEIRSSAPQFIGGSSVRHYTSQAAGEFDWNGLLNDPLMLGDGGKLFLITATAQNMNVFYGYAQVDVYQTTSTNQYTSLSYMNDFAAGGSPITTNFVDAPNDTSQPEVKKWFAEITGDSTKQLWVKFSVVGLDQATVTITALT
jgi:hypothetical protein